jgi:uncharacterized protein YndB with AHSA1/START domain
VQHINQDGESVGIGEVLQSEPPHLLCYTFQSPNVTGSVPSRVRFELEQHGVTVKLTLIHDWLDIQSCMTMSRKWTARLSYLKRLLEIEDVLALVV